MKKTIIKVSILLFIIFLFLFYLLSFKKNIKLEVNLIQNSSGYYAEVSNMNFDAKLYKIYVKTVFKVIIYEKEITGNINKIELPYPKYGDIYTVYAVAYNKDNKPINTSNEKDFIWSSPTFDRSGDYIINKNSSKELKIDGQLGNNLKLVYKYENRVIFSTSKVDNIIYYPDDLFTFDQKKLTVFLMKNETIVDQKSIYINVNKIGPVKITNPINYSEYVIDDILVNFDGGEGANTFELQVKDGDVLINRKIINSSEPKQFVIESSIMSPNKSYKVNVIAKYNDYDELAQKNEVGFIIRDNTYVTPVFIDSDVHIIKGQKIELGNVLKNVKIIYTLDGTNPSETNGIIYDGPIELNSNITIKTIAINKEGVTSIVSNFDYVIGKKEIKIFVSPSIQDYNHGHSKTPYSTENIVMNHLADMVIPKLKEKGFIVYRNNPNTTIPDWARDAKRKNVDFYLALHSNGSKNHDTSGVKSYIDYDTSASYSIANKIQEMLISIYPYKLNPNNGITYAKNSLGEVRTSMVPFGVLLEIGYHDDYYDAMWIMSSLEEIATSIVEGVSEYYGY